VFLDEKFPESLVLPEPDEQLCPGLRRQILKKWKPAYLKGPIITENDIGEIKSPLKKHIAQRYNFRNIKTTASPWRFFVGTEYNLSNGIRLLASGYNPITHYTEEDSSVFHLLFLWRDKTKFNNQANPFYAFRSFIRHLQEQPKCKIKAVILRPVSPLDSPHEYKELNVTDFMESNSATTERLKHMYSNVLGAFESRMKDGHGGNYWTVPFQAKDPSEFKPFRWPELLKAV
jgi:hypothetical protein